MTLGMKSQSLNVLHMCISQDDNEREREGEREREREREREGCYFRTLDSEGEKLSA